MLEGVCKGLLDLFVHDGDLATRVQVASTLQYYFKHQQMMDLIQTHFTPVLNSYIQLMRDIDNDSLVYSLEIFVRRSGDAVIPHALVLAEQMSQSFMKYATESNEDEDD